MGMQNKVKYMKKLFQNPNIYKKKKSSNETSSPNIILLRQTSPNTNCDLFLPSARQRQTYTHNDIQTYRVQKDKKKKRKISSEKEHDPVTEPSHDRHFHSRGGSCARCPVSSIPETNIQGFLKSGRCLPWKSITSATRCVTLKPLKQGTLLITCYPAVYDQRSPRKIFGKRIETYTSDTLSKRHCVAVYLPSVAHEGRGGC